MPRELFQLDDSILQNAYYRMLDAAPDALVIADADGIIRLVNAQAESLFGYTRAELLGATVELLLPERVRAAHVRHRASYAATPKLRAMGSGLELHGRRKDGSEFPLEVSLSPLKTEAGLFVLSALRDISRRKKAELATLLLAAIVDSSEDAILSMTLDGTITSWNRGASNVFGYEAEEAIGQSISMLTPGTPRQEPSLQLARLARGEPVEPYEVTNVRKDGRSILVSVRLSPIRDARGALLGCSSTARDITEQRIVEERARLVGERLLSAVESIQGMFALFDADDRVVVCNSSFRLFFHEAVPGSMVGCTFNDLVDGSLRAGLFDLGELTHDGFRAHWIAQHRKPQGTFDLRTRDQRTLRLADRPTAEGGVVKTIWDISEDVQRADELRRAHVLAENASAAKSEFLASMSHELRTPLNAILGFAQLLQRDKKTPLTERQHTKVGHILKGGEHLLRLIDDVLDLAQIEAGRVTISLEPVDVAEVLGDVLTTLGPMAARPQIALTSAQLVPGTHYVVADRTRFSQVLMNFGSNAIKYGKAQGQVHFGVARTDSGRLRICVRDDGHGIAPDKQARLFEPFQRAGQELGPIEGTGIGLMISRRLADIMGGQVGFRSELGVGSEFWVELPALDPAQVAPANLATDPTGCVALAGAEHTIVYVEDNPSNVAFMREVIGEFPNVALVVAHTAEQGLAIVRANPPDVVIMDIHLPGMSGIDAARQLRAWPETRDVPTIALTAAAMIRDSQKRDAAVFDRYLTKPIKVDELTGTLAALLAAKQPASD